MTTAAGSHLLLCKELLFPCRALGRVSTLGCLGSCSKGVSCQLALNTCKRLSPLQFGCCTLITHKAWQGRLLPPLFSLLCAQKVILISRLHK